MKSYNLKSLLGISTIAVLVTCGNANAMTMLEAVQRALHTNPEIGQAAANRAGVQFELEQGKGSDKQQVAVGLKVLLACSDGGTGVLQILSLQPNAMQGNLKIGTSKFGVVLEKLKQPTG